ncbi:MAG: polyphosphate kinase 2 family protein [Gloeomargaritaceae cyanobacterium C42_A2020_066]|nr:polyphosphate kinase 2 family protein [Gloeomargaritaceae cyanobacterium C42_A2020_066]
MRVAPHTPVRLSDYATDYTGDFAKKEAAEILSMGIERLALYQDRLYAQNRYALLIIFQALDAAGKDGTIKHVMSGINPQGCQVFSFKVPSAEELDHDYLWRYAKSLPERGRIGIFNRSYYEEVLVVRVHPELLEHQQLPPECRTGDIWSQRFAEINHFEQYLSQNGIVILKFFLHVSKAVQKKRFLERIDDPAKNWKFSLGDVQERAHWDDYQTAYEGVLSHTSTPWAPWHIIPADHKWFTRLAVAAFIYEKLESLQLHYPTLSSDQQQILGEARATLLKEPEA